jgi:hypothetical protein
MVLAGVDGHLEPAGGGGAGHTISRCGSSIKSWGAVVIALAMMDALDLPGGKEAGSADLFCLFGFAPAWL